MPVSPGPVGLFVTTDFPPDFGGLQSYSFRISRDLKSGLLSHILIGSDHPESELPALNINLKRVVHSGRGRIRAFIWSLWRIPYFRFLQGTQFQLHMQWSTAFSSFLLKKMGTGTSYFILIHGVELLDPSKSWLNTIKRLILENANVVIAGSNHTAEILPQLGIQCKRLEVLHYGNPLEGEFEFSDSLAQKPLVGQESSDEKKPLATRLLCMHRLVERKGTSLLLEALSQIVSLPWTLDIVGQGEDLATLKSQVKRLGLASQILFHPPVDLKSKIKMMRNADLFILPSLPPNRNNHFEGLGLALLEAQSLGIPVLAARTGGIPEAIKEGLTGILFRAGDQKDLQEKLLLLLENPELRKALGKAGPNWVNQEFSWKRSLEKLAKIIEEECQG